MTHEELRKAAVKWLANTGHCSVVLSEMVTTATSEIPDAIGWSGCVSTLVECKASRSDFAANRHKCHEASGGAVGRYRYFLVPEGLVSPGECEDGYGLLWFQSIGATIRVKKKPEYRETNKDAEIGMLVSALRRVKTREFLTLNICDECAAMPGGGK